MKSKKAFVLIVALAMLVSVFFGCTAKDEDTTVESPEESQTEDVVTSTEPTDEQEDSDVIDLGGETYVIKAACTQAETSNSAEIAYLKIIKEYVEEKTDGAVTIDIYPGGQLGTDAEVVQSLMGGTLEMGVFNYANLNSVYPDTMVVGTPGFFRSEEEVDAIMSGEWGTAFHAAMEEETSLKMLSAICNGFRCFTSNTELTTVDTAKGVTFRTMTSTMSVKMVEALGANAVPMASSEMYTAMQNGTVDGQENPVINIINDKTYEVQKYLVLDKHMASIAGFGMSSTYFNSLPEALQECLMEAVELAEETAAEMIVTLNEEGLQTLIDYGMSVYEPTEEELIAWQTPIAEACEAYAREELGDTVVDDLLQAIEDYRG